MTALSEAKIWGDAAESAVEEYLKSRGWRIIRLHDIRTTRGGPRAEGLDGDITLPDLETIKDGVTRYAEVKFKDHPERYHKTGELRHGIDLPKWNDYNKACQESGKEGYLFIVQYKDRRDGIIVQKLLYQSFITLDLCLRIGDGANRWPPGLHPDFPHGGVFWDVRHFKFAGTLPRHFGLGLGNTVTEALDKVLRAERPDSVRLLPSVKRCPICGRVGFLGLANNPSVQYCPDHAPGFSDQDRAFYGNVITLARARRR